MVAARRPPLLLGEPRFNVGVGVEVEQGTPVAGLPFSFLVSLVSITPLASGGSERFLLLLNMHVRQVLVAECPAAAG